MPLRKDAHHIRHSSLWALSIKASCGGSRHYDSYFSLLYRSLCDGYSWSNSARAYTVWRGEVGWGDGERKLVDGIYLACFVLDILKLSGFLL